VHACADIFQGKDREGCIGKRDGQQRQGNDEALHTISVVREWGELAGSVDLMAAG
jgi:hypothetical protein